MMSVLIMADISAIGPKELSIKGLAGGAGISLSTAF